jgi:hypothetical protein
MFSGTASCAYDAAGNLKTTEYATGYVVTPIEASGRRA